MSWFRRFVSPKRSAPDKRRSSRLAVEQLESRLVPSYTFADGTLNIHADAQDSSDAVHIRAAGTASDGSTGVQVDSNLVNGGAPTTFGDSSTPVVRIRLDLKDGNDNVRIAGLAQTTIIVGEGNGDNFISIGKSQDIGIIAGSGPNNVEVGGGTGNALVGLAPGNALSPAGTTIFVGWNYTVDSTGRIGLLSLAPDDKNNVSNSIVVRDHQGESAVVDIAGDGPNDVFTGDGNDLAWIQGNGDNRINADEGNNQIQVDGNGNNHIKAKGTGSITVNGQGDNQINAGSKPNDAVFLSFSGQGGRNHVKAANGAHVEVNGAQVTLSGRFDGTNTFVRFGSEDDDDSNDMC